MLRRGGLVVDGRCHGAFFRFSDQYGQRKDNVQATLWRLCPLFITQLGEHKARLGRVVFEAAR